MFSLWYESAALSKTKSLALLISMLYSALGGVVVCSLSSEDPLNGDWVFARWLITLPVTLISGTFRFTGDIGYTGVILIQAMMIIPTFLVVSQLMANRARHSNFED